MLKYGSVLYNKSFKIEETFEDTVIKPTFIQMREMLARFVRVSLQRFFFFFLAKKLDTKNQNPIYHKQELVYNYSNILGFCIF